MIELQSLYILTTNGESVLPDSIQRKRATDQNRPILFYLDANLCLDIVSYFENKPTLPQSRMNVETLIVFCQQYAIEPVPKFGSMELCKENLQQLNIQKYQDFVNKITYVFDTPFSESARLNELKFNYYVEVNETDSKALENLFPLLLISYVALLKIYVLCKNNPPKKNSVLRNLKIYLHWCNKHLDASMAAEIQLAVKIFGGDSKFRKMIALDKKADKPADILKAIWGTAWDLFHMRMLNFKAIHTGIDYDTYLITQDVNLFTLFKTCRLHGALSASGESVIAFMGFDIDIPYKDEFILQGITNTLDEFSNSRALNKNVSGSLDAGLLDDLKIRLENAISISG